MFMALMRSCLLSCSHYIKNRKPAQVPCGAYADFLFFIRSRSLERGTQRMQRTCPVRRMCGENLSIEKRFLRKSLRTTVPNLLKKDEDRRNQFLRKNCPGKVAHKRQEDSKLLPSVRMIRLLWMKNICKVGGFLAYYIIMQNFPLRLFGFNLYCARTAFVVVVWYEDVAKGF